MTKQELIEKLKKRIVFCVDIESDYINARLDPVKDQWAAMVNAYQGALFLAEQLDEPAKNV
jgi:hypothetical protein